ncbi:hypothetical protein Tco_0520923 [Tanacetum coccineum]
MTRNLEEHGFLSTILKQRRNHKQSKLLVCLLLITRRTQKGSSSTEGSKLEKDKTRTLFIRKSKNVKTASTPIETQKPLLKDADGEDVDEHLYRSMIGSLMYLTSSRPDIMFAVCACARFQVNPKSSHLHAMKRIFRYLKVTMQEQSLDRKSTIGGCQFLRCRLISWQCKKQTVVANSTTEAEYIAASNCCGQVLWIQNQLLDYGYNFMQTKIHIDNESTICIVKNPVFHSKTKHIEIMHHFIRDSYEKKLIQMIKIHTDQNVVDLLTKAFDVSRFQYLIANKKKVIITESTIRRDLQLEDANGIDCLLNATIFEQLTLMGYEKLSQKLTFYKAFFSPQWEFLIHIILQCLCAKTSAWNEFSSTMAFAIICLATNQKFNFSKYIFDNMVKNVDSMKIFRNMKREGKCFSGRVTPLFQTMMVQAYEEMGEGPRHYLKISEIASLKEEGQEARERNKSRTPRLKRVKECLVSARRIESFVEASLGRNMDNLMFDTGVLDEQEVEVEKVVSTAEVTTESATTTTVDELTLAQTLIEIKAAKPKDKGKAKMIESEKPLKKKDQIMYDQEVALNLQAQLQAELEDEERLTRQKEEEANIALIES